MKKLIIVALAILSLSCGDTLATNYIKIINTTDQTLKVGLFKSMINFTEMRVDPRTSREYDTGKEQDCLKKVTINGQEVWSGNNCDNYEITINKLTNNTFAIKFSPSSKPKPAPFDPSQGLDMS